MNEDNTNYEKSKKDFQSIKEFSERINDMAKQLLLQLELTDYKVMDAFRPFIQPKKNIAKLQEFYVLFTKAKKDYEGIKIDIEKEDLNKENEVDLKTLSKIKIIGKIEHLNKIIESLDEYLEVKIVDHLVSEIKKYIKEIVVIVKLAFFNALDRLPKVVVSTEEYARFLLKNTDNKTFLSEYSKTVYKRLGFVKTDNFNALLQQTKDLTKYFNIIVNLNCKILGKKVAQNINVGLISLMIINLKGVINDTLSIVDKNNKPEYIPFLINLYSNLRHSEGPMIRELEDIFVFRNQINKLILNCLIQFFYDLEEINKPNSKCIEEEFCKEMSEILTAFNNNKECKRTWIESYGPSLGVYKTKELESNFVEKCLIKVKKLSNSVDGVLKYIYLINNFYIFRENISRFEEHDLKELIDKNTNLILGMWKINISNLSGTKVNKFLSSELSKYKKYRLPDEQRIFLKDKIKEIVEGLIATEDFQGNFSDISAELEQVYSGN